jgi:PhnB protein
MAAWNDPDNSRHLPSSTATKSACLRCSSALSENRIAIRKMPTFPTRPNPTTPRQGEPRIYYIGMLSVNPYIAYKGNCREAIEFYKSALDAQVLFTQTVGQSPMANMGPPDNIMHCTIKVGDSTIMMCDDPTPAGGTVGDNISLAIGLKDPERAKVVFGNLSKGGTVIMPLDKTFWAEAFGMVTDKFGIKWMVNCEAPKPA